jgi:hypothetical protein
MKKVDYRTIKIVAKLSNLHQHFLLGAIKSKINSVTAGYGLLWTIVVFFLDLKPQKLRHVPRYLIVS